LGLKNQVDKGLTDRLVAYQAQVRASVGALMQRDGGTGKSRVVLDARSAERSRVWNAGLQTGRFFCGDLWNLDLSPQWLAERRQDRYAAQTQRLRFEGAECSKDDGNSNSRRAQVRGR
jgi:hypothetical protein